MRKTAAIAVLAALMAGISAASPVEVGLGTLKIGGVLQTVYGYAPGGLGQRTWSFTEKRVRLIFNGDLPEQRVKYLVQLEALSPSPLLDARVQACGWLPMTDVYAGRFIPSVGHYMPRSTALLEMINYPLLVTKYAMWRQVGAQTTTKLGPVDWNMGVFNGYPANNTADYDPGKDLLFSGWYRGPADVQLFGYGWLGNAVEARDDDPRRNWFGGGAMAERKLWEGMTLVLRGETADGQARAGRDGPMVRSGGFYVHMGFKPHPRVELLGRWDRFDTKGDDDGAAWITGGINYHFSGTNLMLYANYVHKRLETNPFGNDDEFLLQAQLAF
jgi:ribosomal protein S16